MAIVGVAGRYPGADNADEMWDMFVGYRSGVGELPAGRWSEYAADKEMTRRMADAVLTGGYLEDIAAFDAEFFGLSPLEAANMDPQQRIVLQLTWEALENAGIPANQLRGLPVGVFMASNNNDYGMLISADPAEAHPYALTGNSSAIIANRISYAFDFRDRPFPWIPRALLRWFPSTKRCAPARWRFQGGDRRWREHPRQPIRHCGVL